jgi:Fic family protein
MLVSKRARLEQRKGQNGQVHFYLVKDMRVGAKKAKVTKYLGTEEPTLEDLEKMMITAAFELEAKTIGKRAELSVARYNTLPFDNEEGEALIELLENFRYLQLALREHLRVNEIAKYEELLEYKYVQGSTSIEGNTLTLKETRLLLSEGMIPSGRSLREINEVQNFRVIRRIRDAHRGKVTPGLIRRMHAEVMHNIDPDGAGQFRRVDDIAIVGRDDALTPSILVETELKEALETYYQSIDEGAYPFFAAVIFHHRLECIHPFTDGNGRVGREIFNIMVTASKFPRLLFLGEDRTRYLQALSFGDEGQEKQMIELFARLLISQRKDVAMEKLRQLTDPSAIG